jgi:protein O-mannosyl-transferase
MSKKYASSFKKKPLGATNQIVKNKITKLNAWAGAILAILAFILYSQSINHNYTLDDHPVIDQNSVTRQGISGIPTILITDYWYGYGHQEQRGPIYRPTSMIVFAIIWQLFPDNPHIYHFINVLFYSLTCLILFFVLRELFSKQDLLFPFICTLLYTAHPIHSEVVNNIKSLDEILCFLFGIISIWFIIKYISTKSRKSFIIIGISFFLSLVSKETGISFLLILPLTIFFFYDNFKKPLASVSILLISITVMWLILRKIIFADLERDMGVATSILNNTLNAAPDFFTKYATIFYILLRYVVLLIFPHPLTCDYNYAQIKIHNLNDPDALLGVILYVGLGLYSIVQIKSRNILVFAILFFLITLAPISNVFFLGGSTMAERFLYMPSLGFCIVLTHFIIKFTKSKIFNDNNLNKLMTFKSTIFLIVFSISFLYSLKIISRNKDWKDDITIFSHDVKTSINSATANYILGNSLFNSVRSTLNKKNQLDTFMLAKHYLKRALEISPDYRTATSYLSYIYIYENKIDSAYLYLKKGLMTAPNDAELNYYYGTTLYRMVKYDEAIYALKKAISLNPKLEGAYFMLAASYLTKGDSNNGLSCYLKIIEINPSNELAYRSAVGIYKTRGDTLKSKELITRMSTLGYKQN